MTDCTVLLIEDDDDFRAVLTRGLKRADFGVVTASSGNEGLEILARQAFTIVVSDILMDEGEGIETLTRIRALYPDLPVIGISGYPAYLDMFKALGAVATLAKPFRIATLIDLIDQANRDRNPGTAPGTPVV